MATSGSTNYTYNRDELIKDALIDIGAVAAEDSVSSTLNEWAARKLNTMLKSWQGTIGLNLWKLQRVTVLLEKDKQVYSIGPAADNATLNSDLVETEIRVAAANGATILEVDSTTDMTASDVIGVQVDDGTLHVTTISSITDGDTLVLTTGLDDASAINNNVYTFTTKIPRPLAVTNAWIRQDDDNDRPIRIFSREEYYRLGNKNNSNEIVEIYYDPQLTNGQLYVFNPVSKVDKKLELVCQMPIEDMDAAADDFDFPNEWWLPIQLNLSLLLAPGQGLSSTDIYTLKKKADEELEKIKGWDKENTSTFIQPDFYGYS